MMWKPVAIDGNVFTGSFEGLVGIDECTDYNLEEFASGNKKRKLKSSTQKSNKKCNKVKVIKSDAKNDSAHKSLSETITPSKEGNTTKTIENELLKQSTDSSTNEMELWNNFGIHKLILRGLKCQKFLQPTQIQSMTFPAAIFGKRDILGAAETGSGKTLAFGIPILNGILKIKEKANDEDHKNNMSDSEDEESDFEMDTNSDNDIGCVKKISLKSEIRKPLYALILTPTRELAIQVKNHITMCAKFTGINVAVVVGGMAAVKQERILSKGPEIVVATPGRLWELIQQGNPHLSQIDNIKYLAIDETDRMLEKGHFQELHDILERLNFDEENRKQRQNFVFSATLTLVHDLPKHLINKSKIKRTRKIQDMTSEQKLKKIVDMLGITNPKVIDLSEGTGKSGTLTECRINCSFEEKDYYVYYFLKKHPGRTLIFCNSIGCVKRLTTLLGLLECSPMPLHASMPQRQRLKNLERFRDNENSILIATDVAARGLDIPNIEHVLHYQTPRTSESYVHRSGRTARASNEGLTVLLIEPGELTMYLKLCRTLGKDEDIPMFPVQENYLNSVKQRVNLARELDKLQLQVRKANSEAGWLQKAATEMDIIVDDMAKKYDTEEAQTSKRLADVKRKQLSYLLTKTIFPKKFTGKYSSAIEQLDTELRQGETKKEAAVDVMKTAMELYAKKKKKTVALYKPRNKGEKLKSGFSGKLVIDKAKFGKKKGFKSPRRGKAKRK